MSRFEHQCIQRPTLPEDWHHQNEEIEREAQRGWELVSVVIFRPPKDKFMRTLIWFKRPYQGGR